ncbi:GntR family transcriptional regulator [Bosea vestrisii]|uniref:GntR family transcriptional regulator n=1 Tax=Bosea vestrisii TaxID=151416 RepID=UPI003D768CE5
MAKDDRTKASPSPSVDGHPSAASAPPSHGGTGEKEKHTISTRLVSRMREAILRGELAPGSKINLDKARRTFDVSLSPMREALARLTSVGLVELHDNRGYTVAPVSLSNLREITQLRAEFECLALDIAMQYGDLAWESGITRALHRLNRIHREASDTASLEAWEDAHRDFHLTLIQGCDMPILLNFCTTLHNLNDRYRRIFLTRTGGDANVEQEHNQIAQGAVARDRDYARDRLREHILRTGRNLQNALSDERAGAILAPGQTSRKSGRSAGARSNA